MKSSAENRKDGAKKLVLGGTVAAVGGFFYGIALPVGIISSVIGSGCVAAGTAMQGMSKDKESRTYKLGSAIRFAGACALSFGIGAITSPASGSLYAIEGIYNITSGKELNLFGKASGFIFGIVAGPEYREDFLTKTPNSQAQQHKISEEQAPLNEKTKKQAVEAAKGANEAGIEKESGHGLLRSMYKKVMGNRSRS